MDERTNERTRNRAQNYGRREGGERASEQERGVETTTSIRAEAIDVTDVLVDVLKYRRSVLGLSRRSRYVLWTERFGEVWGLDSFGLTVEF